jgi:hypothetical protein
MAPSLPSQFVILLRRTTCAAALLVGAVAIASPASAQQPPTAAPAQHTVVLLAEMTGDAAIDAHLRVATDALVQRLRARGYDLAPPAAVGAAMQRGVAEPNALRTAVGAELAVRTNVRYRDRDRAVVHITVFSGLGERATDVTATPNEIDSAVPAAVDSLLPAPGTTQAPVAPGPPPPAPNVPISAPGPAQPGVDRVVLKDGSVIEGRVVQQVPGSYVTIQGADFRTRTIPWDRVVEVFAQPPRSAPPATSPGPGGPAPDSPIATPAGQKAWDKRGGSLLTFDAQVLLSGMIQRVQTMVSKEFTTGENMVFTGSSDAGGGGGGAALHIGYMYLSAPDITKSTTWYGLRMGTGLEFAYVAYGHRTDAIIKAGLRAADGTMLIQGSAEGGATKWGSSRLIMIPFALGGQVGLGKFWGDNRWNGVTLGFDYRPTYYHSKPSDFASATDGFNPLGMQLTLNIGSLELGSKPDSSFRMSAMLLPPVGDRPTFLNLGFGIGWF